MGSFNTTLASKRPALGPHLSSIFFACLNLDNKITLASNEISWDSCELKFYGVQNFRVEQDKFNANAKLRKRKTDRSLETLGDCCWALYTRQKYRGRQIIIGSNVKLRKLRRIGRGRRRIRSVEKIEACTNVF